MGLVTLFNAGSVSEIMLIMAIELPLLSLSSKRHGMAWGTGQEAGINVLLSLAPLYKYQYPAGGDRTM